MIVGLLDMSGRTRFVPNARQGLLGSSDDGMADEAETTATDNVGDDLLGVPPMAGHDLGSLLGALAFAPGFDAEPGLTRFFGGGGGGASGNSSAASTGATPEQGGDVLTDGSIKQRIFSNLERGDLPAENVRAIVLHRTGGSTANSTLEAWKTKPEGTHFLIDNDGTIYQTAGLDKSTWHVGPIRARSEVERTWSPEEKKKIADVMAAGARTGRKYPALHDYELTKDYPARYPYNGDSIGIEVVGVYDTPQLAFVPPTQAQLKSVGSLVEALKTKFGLTNADIYHHGVISYKDDAHTEGKGLGY